MSIWSRRVGEGRQLRRAISGKRRLNILHWLAVFAFLLLSTELASGRGMMLIGAGRQSGTMTAYQGPCDVTAGGVGACTEAWSITRAMTSNYSGPLFQLIRSSDLTTLDIPQTAQHTANLSGVYAFCAATPTQCWYSKIYAQIHTSSNNTLVIRQEPVNGGNVICPTSVSVICAAPFWIDWFTGTPILSTINWGSYQTVGTLTGFVDGTSDATIPGTTIFVGRNEEGEGTSGNFGVQANHLENTGASNFGNINIVGVTYGQQNTAVNCGTATTHCMFIDENGGGWDQADMTTANGRMVIESKIAANGYPNYTLSQIYNGTILTAAPPTQGITATGPGILRHSVWYGAASAQYDSSMSLGQEMMYFGRTLSSGDDSAIYNNVTSFYAAQTPATCRGPADYNYFLPYKQVEYSTGPLSASRGAWALYQMGAAQTAPIADLRDIVTNTVHTYGPSSSGCGLNPAAATFCATNGCAVAKLYNQAWWSTQTAGNIHDTVLDMSAASNAAQPTVTFNSLNGRPTMHFSGSQKLCTGPWGTGPSDGSGFGGLWERPWSLSAVARRTGSTSTQQAVMSQSSANGGAAIPGWAFLGFNSVSGGEIAAIGGISGGTTTTATGITENHWHSLGIDQPSTPEANTAVSGSLWADGSAVATKTQPNYDINGPQTSPAVNAYICIGDDQGGGYAFTGDIAEASIPSGTKPSPATTPQTALFAAQERVWGTLPN